MGCPFEGTPAGSGEPQDGAPKLGPKCGGMEKRLSGLRAPEGLNGLRVRGSPPVGIELEKQAGGQVVLRGQS